MYLTGDKFLDCKTYGIFFISFTYQKVVEYELWKSTSTFYGHCCGQQPYKPSAVVFHEHQDNLLPKLDEELRCLKIPSVSISQQLSATLPLQHMYSILWSYLRVSHYVRYANLSSQSFQETIGTHIPPVFTLPTPVVVPGALMFVVFGAARILPIRWFIVLLKTSFSYSSLAECQVYDEISPKPIPQNHCGFSVPRSTT